jgi:Transposase IS116/IS110/IS902 family
VTAPRLLAAFGSQRDRYRSAAELQTYSGIAPVTERSEKRKWVHYRWACPKFLRQSFHEWAGHSMAQSVWARAYHRHKDVVAATTTLRYGRWLLNGFASYSVAGKIGSPMTKINTWRPWLSEARHWVSSP